MAKPLNKEEKEIARKFKKALRFRSLGKLHYAEADKLIDELLAELPNPTKKFRLVRSGKKLGFFEDNYAGTNVAFRQHGIKRYEPKVEEIP